MHMQNQPGQSKFEVNCSNKINQTANATVNATQTGSLEIRSTPNDASVYVNQELKGETPLTINDFIPGSMK